MTLHKLSILLFIPLLTIACNENNTTQNTPPTNQTPIEPIEKLRDTAIPEEDIIGRIDQGLATVQTEYDRSVGSMPDLGKVTIESDFDCVLTIRNEKDGTVYETKVDMNDLNTEQGGFRLIPDHAAGDFPGLRISTKNDAPKVVILKDGKEMTKDNQLVIYLADRPAIEKITPAILQTIRICQNEK